MKGVGVKLKVKRRIKRQNYKQYINSNNKNTKLLLNFIYFYVKIDLENNSSIQPTEELNYV